MGREEDLYQLYRLMDKLTQKVGGKRLLKDCEGKMGGPQRGVYFFLKDGELK